MGVQGEKIGKRIDETWTYTLVRIVFMLLFLFSFSTRNRPLVKASNTSSRQEEEEHLRKIGDAFGKVLA